MPTKKALGDGIGAVGKAKMKMLHPSAPLVERYGTNYKCAYLGGLVIQQADRGKVSR